jgi:hypothetical protein
MAKQARKVALINVHDYSGDKYSAYYEIRVMDGDDGQYAWGARIYSRKEFEGVEPTRHCKVLEEALDGAPDRDAADTAAQNWVKEHMEKYRLPTKTPGAGTLSSFAIPFPVDGLGLIWDDMRRLWEKFGKPLLALAYSQTVRHNRLHAVRDAIDGGAGAGLLRIYDGSRPATCGTATTLLAELTFTDPCAGAASGGVLTMSAITADASANATGTASWFRCVDSTGTCVIDGNVGTSGSDLNLNSTSINSGVQVSVTSFTITAGNA